MEAGLRRAVPLVVLASLGIIVSASASKLEDELRDKLASSEAARIAAMKDKAAAVAALDQLTKSKSQATAVNQSAAQVAAKDAEIAQNSAENLAITVQQAAMAASTAALIAQQQAQKFNSNSMALIGVQTLVFLGIISGFVHNAMMAKRDHKWALEAADRTQASVDKTHETMKELEKNTNSMVEIMRKSASAEGFAAGFKARADKEGVKDGEKDPIPQSANL